MVKYDHPQRDHVRLDEATSDEPQMKWVRIGSAPLKAEA